MFKLRILEKVMQVVTTVSKVVHTVKEKIHEVTEQVEARYQKAKEERAKKALSAEETTIEETSMGTAKSISEQAPQKGTRKKQTTFAMGRLKHKTDTRRHLSVYKKENNVIYLTSAFKKPRPVLKAYEDVYIDLMSVHSREPTLEIYSP